MRRAYTLIEVMIVVVVMSIVAAVVVPQMLKAGTLGVQAATRMIIADILYAQNDAVARQSLRRVVFDLPGNRYHLADAEGDTLATPWRGGGDRYTVDLNRDKRFAGVRLVAVDFDGDGTLEFDDMGGPSSGGHVTLEFNNERFRINVAPFTGRVTVQQIKSPS